MPITSIKFGTYGPYTLKRHKSTVTRDSLAAFWTEADVVASGIGVYVISATSGKRQIPWYVGKTDGGFKRRFTQHFHGKTTFNKLASAVPKGDLEVMFLARHTNGGKLKKARKLGALTRTKAVPTIKRLEYDVLKAAHAINSALVNKSNRVYLGSLSVPGLTGPDVDAETAAAEALRGLLQSESVIF